LTRPQAQSFSQWNRSELPFAKRCLPWMT
jgi:hypothetical protein